jgi:hypothetical protein
MFLGAADLGPEAEARGPKTNYFDFSTPQSFGGEMKIRRSFVGQRRHDSRPEGHGVVLWDRCHCFCALD